MFVTKRSCVYVFLLKTVPLILRHDFRIAANLFSLEESERKVPPRITSDGEFGKGSRGCDE